MFLFTDPPEVLLTLGSTLNPDDIKENDDVYFECNVKANPSSVKISWLHDVSKNFHVLDFVHFYKQLHEVYSILTRNILQFKLKF